MTPEQINALPEQVRRYIHDLETRCDPAGDVAALALTRDQNAQLAARVAELEAAGAEMHERLVAVYNDRSYAISEEELDEWRAALRGDGDGGRDE